MAIPSQICLHPFSTSSSPPDLPLAAIFVAAFPLPYFGIEEAAVTCSDVIKDMRPCVNYLKTGSGMPPAACCTGASALASAAATSADRKTACNCIKSVSKNMNVNPSLGKALPGNCGISLGFTVDPNVDCSKVS